MLFTIYVLVTSVCIIISIFSILPELSFTGKMKPHLRLSNLSMCPSNLGMNSFLELPYGRSILKASTFQKAFDFRDEFLLPRNFKLAISLVERDGQTPYKAVIKTLTPSTIVTHNGRALQPYKPCIISQGESIRIQTLDHRAMLLTFDFFR